MANKWYFIKLNGHYLRKVDLKHSNTTACVSSTDKLVDAKLLNNDMRKNWIMSMALTLKLDPDKDEIKSFRCDVETTPYDGPEDENTLYAIRFKKTDGTHVYFASMDNNGIDTITTEDISESQQLDLADLNKKDTSDKIVKLLTTMQCVGILSDELENTEIEQIAVQRTYENIVEL